MIGSKADVIANEYLVDFGFHPRGKRNFDVKLKYKRSASFHKSIKNGEFALFYRLTNNIISKSLHFLRYCFNISENNKGNKIPEGVSDAVKNARTQMAQAKENRFAGRLLGAGLALSAAFAPMAATAQEITPAANNQATHQMDAELLELHESALAARKYATDNKTVAILLHVADDIATRPDRDAVIDKLTQYFEAEFAKRGINVEVFTNRNLNASATLLRYYIADKIYTIKDGNRDRANLGLGEADKVIDDVVTQLSLDGKVASLAVDERAPALEN